MTTVVQRFNLLRGLVTRRKAYAGPFFATISTTERCNLHCLHCRWHSPKVRETEGRRPPGDFPLDVARGFFAQLQRRGAQMMVFSGDGEPMLHPHFEELLAAAKGAGLRVLLITNGTLIDRAWARYFVEVGVDELRVSLWSASEDGYARLYPGTDLANYVRVLDGLRLVAEEKKREQRCLPQLIVHQPIDRHNFREVGDLARLAHEVDCDKVSFSPLLPVHPDWKENALSPEQEKELATELRRLKHWLREHSVVDNIEETLLRYRVGPEQWDTLPCYMPWLHCRVRVNGDVFPCGFCRTPFGNLRETSLAEIWDGPVAQDFRSRAISGKGLAGLAAGECNCAYCCHLPANYTVHQVWKWLAPLASCFGR